MSDFKTIEIPFSYKIVPAELDGSKCVVCDDVIFLFAYRIQIFIGKNLVGWYDEMVCGSCKDIIEDDFCG